MGCLRVLNREPDLTPLVHGEAFRRLSEQAVLMFLESDSLRLPEEELWLAR